MVYVKAQELVARRTSGFNEQIMFIFNKYSGMAPYSHEFIEGMQDPQMLSGFLSAMQSFVAEVAGIKQRGWKIIYGQDTTLLVEPANWAIGVLAVTRETNEARSKLRSIVLEFEDTFQFLRDEDTIDGSLFDDFDNFVRRTFLVDRLTKRTMIVDVKRNISLHDMFKSVKMKFEIARIIKSAREGQTLFELANELNVNFDDLVNIVSIAIWNNLINVVFVPDENDILSLSPGSLGFLLSIENPESLSIETIRTISRLDGRAPLYKIFETLKLDYPEFIIYELGSLLSRGYIQKVSIEKRLLLASECILTGVIQSSASKIGQEQTMRILQRAIIENIDRHPWLSRVFLKRDLSAYVALDVLITPREMSQIGDSIDHLIDNVSVMIGEVIGKKSMQAMLTRVKNTCNEKWKPYIIDSSL